MNKIVTINQHADMPRVSVIIPTFNRAWRIMNAIDSVLAQTCKPLEIIVVDDGSTDNTRFLIRTRYPNIILISSENRGVSTARNLGVKMATGDWIAFLDSDDSWHPEKLARQFQALEFQPDFKVCHTDEIWIRNGRRIYPRTKHRKHGGFIFRYCLPLCVISPSSVLVHRSVFDTIGLFDETLPCCEDYDLWLRLCARFPLLYLEEKLVTKYGGHKDQLSQKYWGMDRFRIFALAKIINNPAINESDRNAAKLEINRKLKIFLQGARKHKNNNDYLNFSYLLKRYNYMDTNNHTSNG